jgi:hypothetical protein
MGLINERKRRAMGAIVTKLNVPELPSGERSDEKDKDARADFDAQTKFARGQYAAIIASLRKTRLHPIPGDGAPPEGIPVDLPEKGADEITGAEMEAHLQRLVGEIVRREVLGNRDTYDGLSHAQIAKVFQRLAQQNVGNLPYAPNLLSTEDIAAALEG